MTLDEARAAHPEWFIWHDRDRYFASPLWEGAVLDKREAPTLDELVVKLRFSERTRVGGA